MIMIDFLYLIQYTSWNYYRSIKVTTSYKYMTIQTLEGENGLETSIHFYTVYRAGHGCIGILNT